MSCSPDDRIETHMTDAAWKDDVILAPVAPVRVDVYAHVIEN